MNTNAKAVLVSVAFLATGALPFGFGAFCIAIGAWLLAVALVGEICDAIKATP